MTSEQAEERLPISVGPLLLAALALLLCWIPWAGLLLSVAALALCLRARGRGRVGWALGLAVYALLLGGGFTAVYLVFPPARESQVDRDRYEAFERLFEAPGGAGGADAAP